MEGNMIVKDKAGREIEISVYGRYEDDIQIDSAQYVDGDDEVSEETCEYIYEHYQSELYEAWFDQQCGRADFDRD